MGHRPYADGSRLNWGRDANEALTVEQINSGCLQRIATATEAMAKGHVALAEDRDWQKRRRESAERRAEALERSNNALRGVITRIKRKTLKAQQ